MEKRDYLDKIFNRRSFSGLMEVYEKNYMLLDRLIPELDDIPVKTQSRIEGSPTLYLVIEERCKFTTMLSLTYYFTDVDDMKVANPDLNIRIYHDARQAEAMSCMKTGLLRGKVGQIPIKRPWIMSQSMIDCKWENNLFLEKWLNYSLAQGHRFSPDDEVEAESKIFGTVLEPI